MGHIDKTVFISYRRTNYPWALAFYQYLTAHGYDVFFDFTSLNSGDFETIILENIRGRAHFLVLLTPSALERCDDPGDWLRREIETALDTKRNIVALMLEGFDYGSPSIAKYLTGKMAALKKYNALNVPVGYFDEAMDRLCGRFLNVPLDSVAHPVSETAREVAQEQQGAAGDAPLVEKRELTAQEWFEQGFVLNNNSDREIYCYTEAIRLKPDYAAAYNNRGVVRSGKGDLDGALQDCSEAIRLQPDYAAAYNNRGLVRSGKGDLDGALQDYDEAIRLIPDLAEAYNNRGNVRKEKGDLDGAILDYDEAIRLKPDYADAYYNRGISRRIKGDLDMALQDCSKAIRLKPDYAEAYNNQGVVRRAKGDLDGALQDYDEAIRLKPDLAEAYNNRGNARKEKGDLDGAILDYDEAIHLKPDYAMAYNNRGNVRKAKGDLDGALQDYDEAICLKPDYEKAYYNRAQFWRQKEDCARAIADYQTYLDLGGGLQDGDQKEVEKAIRSLNRKLKSKK